MKNKQMSNVDAISSSFMRPIQQEPNITQREFAEKLGLSFGKVNCCIQALLDKGLIKIHNFRASKVKWRYVYALTPKGFAAQASLTGQFLDCQIREFEDLQAQN
jgi:EPS-associated MarR family transcriptional regulator